MALLTATQMTLIDAAKRTKDNVVMAIAEVLNKVNTVLDDAPWLRGNGDTQHISAKRLSLPAGSFRKINSGVALEKSTTTQVIESIALLESYSRIDSALIELNPDPAAFRMSEDLAFVEGMSQTLANQIFYGTTVGSPEKFDGLATRYATLTTAGVSAVHNVHNYGGTGSTLNSIWIVQWGPTKAHLVYPRNAQPNAGITMTNDDELVVTDANGLPYKVYQSHFKVWCGLAIINDKCVQRVCNIPATASNLSDKLIDALRQMDMDGAGSVMYANSTVLSCLDKEAKDKTNVQYLPSGPFGIPTLHFRGVPVKKADVLLSTESALT
jgi:hypothetical protein